MIPRRMLDQCRFNRRTLFDHRDAHSSLPINAVEETTASASNEPTYRMCAVQRCQTPRVSTESPTRVSKSSKHATQPYNTYSISATSVSRLALPRPMVQPERERSRCNLDQGNVRLKRVHVTIHELHDYKAIAVSVTNLSEPHHHDPPEGFGPASLFFVEATKCMSPWLR